MIEYEHKVTLESFYSLCYSSCVLPFDIVKYIHIYIYVYVYVYLYMYIYESPTMALGKEMV